MENEAEIVTESTPQNPSIEISPTPIEMPIENSPITWNETFIWFQKKLLSSLFTDWSFNRRISVRENRYANMSISIIVFMIALLSSLLPIPMIWFGVSTIFLIISIKLLVGRFKDRNNSARSILLLLIPIVNFVSMVMLLFGRGTPWVNKYGEDPDKEYRREGGVKWYYGWIQGLIFLFLLAGSFYTGQSYIHISTSWSSKNITTNSLQEDKQRQIDKEIEIDKQIQAMKEDLGSFETTTGTSNETAGISNSYTPSTTSTLDKTIIEKILAEAYYQGENNAKIVLIEYTDFICPYCKKLFDNKTLEDAVRNQPTDVTLVLKNMPLVQLHPTAIKWAQAAYCAGKIGGSNKYYAYITEAFKVEEFTDTNVLNIAKTIGLSTIKFKICYNNQATKDGVAGSIQEGKSLFGINGTPGIVVLNRETGKYVVVNGAYPIEKFETEITNLLK